MSSVLEEALKRVVGEPAVSGGDWQGVLVEGVEVLAGDAPLESPSSACFVAARWMYADGGEREPDIRPNLLPGAATAAPAAPSDGDLIARHAGEGPPGAAARGVPPPRAPGAPASVATGCGRRLCKRGAAHEAGDSPPPRSDSPIDGTKGTN
mmetsp:Transcript_52412/g.170126  ORF Transcript_52412/g.170126 Transcript_52412/m.170126 type:complete len:152 (-) Transcript_52412:134-589(-)